MTNGPRRSRSRYPLNQRYCGKTYKDRLVIKKLKQFVVSFTPFLPLAPLALQPILAGCILAAMQRERYLNRWLIPPVLTFNYRYRHSGTFSDAALYDMRITDRGHIQKLIVGLQVISKIHIYISFFFN